MFLLLKSSLAVLTSILLCKNLRESFQIIPKDNFVVLSNKKLQAPFTMHYAVKSLTL